MNLILWKEKKHLRENLLIFKDIWGEAELILRNWGAKEKYFQRAEEFSFRDLGRSVHYFQGSREHRPPLGTSIMQSSIMIVGFHQQWFIGNGTDLESQQKS